MVIARAVYKTPPRPKSEKGARAFSDFILHRGNNTRVVMVKITLVRSCKMSGKLKVFASAAKESPMMMELTKDAKKHLHVIAVEMIHADLGPTDFDHASLNVDTLCSAHVLPIE